MPQLTVAAATMYGCGCLLLVLSAIAWQPGRNPRGVIVALAVIAFVLFAWVLARGRRFTAAEALALSGVQLFTIGCLTWTTHLNLGAFANGTALPIVGVFMVWFLQPARARVVLFLGTAWWFAGILHRDETSLVPFAVSLALQTLLAARSSRGSSTAWTGWLAPTP
ncbi:hypothetical protein [Aeromicrobium wangtongii]|uniref:hypothetical protein n=1 Tax=Aeromicrobium wangtongii TaxID=2969247 RepID=UPI002016F0B6|nr:hypothetical protein [Aeromicrobium wangtongii]MCL3817317.1 hypothetical protein [Aeromicrobium wangtongii]